MRRRWLVGLVLLINLIDTATTYYAVEKVGLAELNPLLAWAASNLGFLPTLGLKTLAVFPLVWVTRHRWYLLVIITGVLSVAVVSNIYQIAKVTS